MRLGNWFQLVALSLVVTLTLGASSANGSAATRSAELPYLARSLVGLAGSYSFTVTFENFNRGSACSEGVSSVAPKFPLSVTTTASPNGWSLSAGDQTAFGNSPWAFTGWPPTADVGDFGGVNGFHASLLAVAPPNQAPLAGKSIWLQIYGPGAFKNPPESCPPPALRTEESPIGAAYPVIWGVGGFEGSLDGGAGCGYLALGGGPAPTSTFWPPTTFTGRFLLTDAFPPQPLLSGPDPAALCVNGRAASLAGLTLVVKGKGYLIALPAGTCRFQERTCAFHLLPGQSITITTVAAPGWKFGSWGGNASCTGKGACAFTLTRDANVLATFVPSSPPGKKTKAKTGA